MITRFLYNILQMGIKNAEFYADFKFVENSKRRNQQKVICRKPCQTVIEVDKSAYLHT